MLEKGTAVPDSIKNAVNLLIVEDNDHVFSALQDALQAVAGGKMSNDRAATLADAIRLVSGGRYTAVLLDLSLPDSDGLATVDGMVAAAGNTPVVVLTSQDDDTIGDMAISRGAQDYLVKGRADSRQILRSVRYATERARAKAELEGVITQLRQTLATVQKLEGLLRICSKCKKIADNEAGQEEWVPLETYLDHHSEARLSHGLCPQCAADYYKQMGI